MTAVEIHELPFNIPSFPLLTGVLNGIRKRFFCRVKVIFTEIKLRQLEVCLSIAGTEFNRFFIGVNSRIHLIVSSVKFSKSDMVNTTFRIRCNVLLREFKCLIGFVRISVGINKSVLILRILRVRFE